MSTLPRASISTAEGKLVRPYADMEFELSMTIGCFASVFSMNPSTLAVGSLEIEITVRPLGPYFS